jgi:hypothetical protein
MVVFAVPCERDSYVFVTIHDFKDNIFGVNFALLLNEILIKVLIVMKNSGICIASALGGALFGAVLAMFLTPKSGQELRDSLREAIDKEVDKVRCHCHD